MAVSIKQLIENEGIETMMQLVISPNKDFAAGLEALSRGVHPETGEVISPSELFEAAEQQGLLLELEKAMICKAVERFKSIYETSPDLLLFVNVSSRFMAYSLEETYIHKCSEAFGIPPSNIFFDIMAFDESQLDSVRQFVETYRAMGYFVCIDNIGTTYSNIDKILYLHPDIVKINISTLRTMDNQGYRTSMIHMLKYMAEHMGIILVAKGIEEEADVAFTFECGAQFMQGFYISKPVDLRTECLQSIVDRYRQLMSTIYRDEGASVQLSRKVTAKVIGIINTIKQTIDFSEASGVRMDSEVLFAKFPMVENFWILDEKGRQQGATVVNHAYGLKNAAMFHVYNDGSDFSGKELYTQLFDTILNVWVTPPFRSILTNNICIGGSIRIDHSPSETVLCMNINMDAVRVEEIKEEPIEMLTFS